MFCVVPEPLPAVLLLVLLAVWLLLVAPDEAPAPVVTGTLALVGFWSPEALESAVWLVVAP